MEAYKTKQKVEERTLTIELPEEFENAEVEVIVLQEKVDNSTENSQPTQSKEEKLAALQKFKGIVKLPFYEPTEDEWY